MKVWPPNDSTHMIYCLKSTGPKGSHLETTQMNLTVR